MDSFSSSLDNVTKVFSRYSFSISPGSHFLSFSLSFTKAVHPYSKTPDPKMNIPLYENVTIYENLPIVSQ